MPKTALAPALLALAAACSGCWFRLGGGTGSLLLTWSFNQGQDCATAGVTELQVSAGGLAVTLPCIGASTDTGSGSVEAATLPRVPAGTQTFTLSGMGQVYDPDAGFARLQVAYQSSFVLDIAEETTNIEPVVDIAPIDGSGQNGDLLLLWSFGGQTCDQEGIDQVTLVLDGVAQLVDGGLDANGHEITVPCRSGGLDGTRLLGLGQNLYANPLSALGPADCPQCAFVAAPTAYVTGATETIEHVDLHPVFDEKSSLGQSVTLSVIMNFGPDGGGCSQSQVDLIHIQLYRSNVNGAGEAIDGFAPPISFQSQLIVDETLPCDALGDSSGYPTWAPMTDEEDRGQGLLCDLNQMSPLDAGSCPVLSGEYWLTLQGLTSGENLLYELRDYDLWVDQGLSNGAAAGIVTGYGSVENLGPIPGVVTSQFIVNLPPASSASQ